MRLPRIAAPRELRVSCLEEGPFLRLFFVFFERERKAGTALLSVSSLIKHLISTIVISWLEAF